MVVCQHIRTNEGNKSFHRPLLYHYYKTCDSMHNIKPLTGYRRKRHELCNLSFPLFFIICHPYILPSSMVCLSRRKSSAHLWGQSNENFNGSRNYNDNHGGNEELFCTCLYDSCSKHERWCLDDVLQNFLRCIRCLSLCRQPGSENEIDTMWFFGCVAKLQQCSCQVYDN